MLYSYAELYTVTQSYTELSRVMTELMLNTFFIW